MNKVVVGRIYHVVDKTNGEVVKVGSTIVSLRRRFQSHDYKKRYTNHFLSLVKEIRSSQLDWYEKNNRHCPFLWHLVASEHLEMLAANTFKITYLSNQISPLDQKFSGFYGSSGGAIGGRIVGGSKEGRERMSRLGKSITPEERVRRARVAGLMCAASGHIQRLQKQFLGVGGLVGGKRNAESGHCARIAYLGGLAGGKTGSAKTNHIRWHERRNKFDINCSHCKESGEQINGTIHEYGFDGQITKDSFDS